MQSFELTTYEKMLLNSCLNGDCLVMSTLFIESDKEKPLINQELIKKSMRILCKRHPFLRAYVQIQENRAFLKIDQDDYNQKLDLEWLDLTQTPINRSRITEECSKFNSKHFDLNNKSLLWRVQVIKYTDLNSKIKYILNLVINLFISDGLNSTVLSIEMVNILNALLDKKVCTEMQDFLSPTENLHFYCEKFNFNTQKKPNFRNSNSKFILPEEFSSKEQEVGFELEFLKLNKELTKKILDYSKIKQVRQSAFFHTLFFYALRDLYLESDLKFPTRVFIDLSANLRLRYKGDFDFSNVGCHACMVKFPATFGRFTNFWKDAQYVQKEIDENINIKTGNLFSVTHNFNDEPKKSNDCDFVLSNLGRHINERVKLFQGCLKIKEIYCSDSLQSKQSKCPAIIVHVLYWRGEMMVQIGANKSKLSPFYFKRLNQIFLHRLERVLKIFSN